MELLSKKNILTILFLALATPSVAFADLLVPLYPKSFTFLLIPIIIIEFILFIFLAKFLKMDFKSGKIFILVMFANIITSIIGTVLSIIIPYTRVFIGHGRVYGFEDITKSITGFLVLFLATFLFESLFYILALREYPKTKILAISLFLNIVSYALLAWVMFSALNLGVVYRL